MRERAKRVLRKLHLDRIALGTLQASWRMLWHWRRALGRDKALVRRYLRDHRVRALQIGCGDHLLDGWLNADLFPRAPGALHLDATAPFPLGDGEFDYVFSEHMIEHIPHSQGREMLSECFRVLRPGGRIRISTPDLAFLVDLYRKDKSALQGEYIRWSTDRYLPGAPDCSDTFVINNFVRDWGHRFIYDEKTLADSLTSAGFSRIVRCGLGESECDALRQLENEGRMPAGFLRLETLTLEATKPQDPHTTA